MKIRDPRVRQVAVGLLILASASALFLGLQFGRLLPGLAGEWFAAVGSMLTTPFLMEFSVAVMGLVLVMAINHWRHKREGDEFVYLEEIQDAPADMPDQARWAVYREKPLEAEPVAARDRLEGALEIGDLESAGEILAAMDEEERRTEEIMRLRIRLARAAGREELAECLEREVEKSGPTP